MNVDFDLGTLTTLSLKLGKSYRILSVTHPLTREFFMMKAELHLPDFISLVKEEELDMEGSHGCIYTISANDSGKGILITSLVDLKTGIPVVEKRVTAEVLP